MALSKKDFISLADFTKSELTEIMALAIKQKALARAEKLEQTHTGRTLACIFHKPSLRTRVSFERAMHQLGGTSLYITEREIGVGSREAPQDVARVLSRYVDGIMIRTFENELVESLAEWASVPVINGLTNLLHPCQVLADMMTIIEYRGSLDGITVTFLGDGNNVARSWVNACSRFNFKFILACPEGYGIDKEFYERVLGSTNRYYEEINDPYEAVKNADVIYTDVWASMGEEAQAEEKKKHFTPYQLNMKVLNEAPEHAVILHCLPAHRGEEITDEVMESDRSLVFDQAENRLHAQRALLSLLISPGGRRG
jgi:ornithine carbamoyltransferase